MSKINEPFVFAGFKSITSIILPASIEKIGDHAFEICLSPKLIQRQSSDKQNVDMVLEESDTIRPLKLLSLMGLWIILDYYDQPQYHQKLTTSTILLIIWIFLLVQIKKTSFNTRTF